MKKFFAFAVAAVTSIAASANINFLNHLAVDVSAGTTGIGAEVSLPLTNFFQVRGGVSFMPAITFNSDVDGSVSLAGIGSRDFDMSIKGDLKRTQYNVILNVYPFGGNTAFFLAGGYYFGGEQMLKVEGHSDEVATWQQQGILSDGYVNIGDYKLDFEENGNIRGGLVVKKVRPYLGIGFGRPCPRGRLGVMFELGVQFMGKMKVCQGTNLDPIDISDLDSDDDWQKWIDKLTVYPVMKLTISGRIF